MPIQEIPRTTHIDPNTDKKIGETYAGNAVYEASDGTRYTKNGPGGYDIDLSGRFDKAPTARVSEKFRVTSDDDMSSFGEG